MTEWTKVGVIGVDAGLCWIGDPCYVISDHCDAFDNRDWGTFLKILSKNETVADAKGLQGTAQFKYSKGHDGLGVCVSTGYGDGVYDVFVKHGNDGRVAEVKVVFINEDDDVDYSTDSEEA